MNASPQTLELMAAKLLDGTITDSEYRELENLVESRPDFAQNVTELVRVEGLLKSLRHLPVAVTPGLLEQVENSVSAMITSNAAAISGGTALAGKTIFGYISGAVGVAVVAGIAYFASNSASTPTENSRSSRLPAPIVVQSVPVQQTAPSVKTPQQLIVKESQNAVSSAPQNVSEIKLADNTVVINDGSITASPKDDNISREIKRCLDNFNRAMAANDLIVATDYAKKLGVLYNSSGKLEPAQQYFELALTSATTAGMTEVIGEIYGNLGLLEVKAGKIQLAKQHFEKAIQTLDGINVPTQKWQVELENLPTFK